MQMNQSKSHSFCRSLINPLYTITPIAGSNGSISPAGIIMVGQGENETFHATPDEGYEVNVWYVNMGFRVCR